MRRYSVKFAQAALMGLALLGLAARFAAGPAHADAVSYSGERRLIRACVLVSDATSDFGNGAGPNNPVPYLFYALDNRTDYKLGGWSFVNPIAPATITQDMYNRWKNRQAGGGTPDPAFQANTPQAALFQVGAHLNKNIGAYWEENLDRLSDSDLSQFDIVFMPLQGSWQNKGTIQFTPDEREKLLHYLDNGGTIWVENEGASPFATTTVNGVTYPNGPFVVGMQLGVAPPANTPTSIIALFHPLVNYPYPIAPTEASSLGAAVGLGGRLPFIAPGGGYVDPHIVVPVLQIGSTPLVYAGDSGAGHLILSEAPIAADINNFLGGTNGVAGGANDGAVSGNLFQAAPQTDVKFAANIVAWLSSIPTPGSNARRTGSTLETIGHNIAPKFNALLDTINLGGTPPTIKQETINNAGSGAVISKNVAFSIDGGNYLHAFNMNPGQSLSGSLFPDEGLPDLSYGYPTDEIWNIQLSNASVRYSTPSVFSTVVTNLNNYTGPYDVLATTNVLGQTEVYQALPRNAQGRLLSSTNLLFAYSLQTNQANNSVGALFGLPPLPVPGPAYAEGVLFVPSYQKSNNNNVNDPNAAAGWHVTALDLLGSIQAGAPVNAFGSGEQGINPTIGSFNPSPPTLEPMTEPVGQLAVGYVKDNATGAIDEVVYAPTQADPGTLEGSVQGLWFRTRSEPLQPIDNGMSGIHTQYEPHGDRSWIPWFVPTQAGSTINMVPVVHVIAKSTATGQVTSIQDYIYQTNAATTPFKIVFGANAPPDNPRTLPGQPQQHYMEIDFANGVTVPVDTQATTYTVTADYFVDWPGDPVNGQALNGYDMDLIASHRIFKLYPENNATQNTHLLGAGVGLAADDALVFATSPGQQQATPTGLVDALTGNSLPDRVYSVLDQYSSQAQMPGGSAAVGPQVNWMFAPTFAESFNGTDIKPRIINADNTNGLGFTPLDSTAFHIMGQPVVSNGIAYVVANGSMGGNFVTVILALNEKIDATIHLNPPIQYTTPGAPRPNRITVQQPDLVRSTSASPAYITLFQGSNYTVTIQSDATGDYITSIHINDMRTAQGMDSFNTAMPIFVTDGNGNRTTYVNPNTGYGPLDNLLWFLVIPQNAGGLPNYLTSSIAQFPELQNIGQATSGPSVFGQTLYYAAAVGAGPYTTHLVAVDLKGAQDGHVIDTTTNTTRVHVISPYTSPATGGPALSTFPIISPPAATENTVALNTADGMAALDNRLTVIADNNRLLEVDAGGSAVWSLNATIEQAIVGDVIPGNGGVANSTVSLARPTVARQTSPNVYMVADANNNRIVQVDHGGKVLNEIHMVGNNLGFLRPGDPLTLNQPTDVQIYTETTTTPSALVSRVSNPPITWTFVNPNNDPLLATHYVIADSGNYRVIEVLDVVDLVTGAPAQVVGNPGNLGPFNMTHQVVFTTQSLPEQNQHFRYRTIQQFLDPETKDANGNPTLDLIAAVDNARLPGVEGASASNFGADGSFQEGPGGSLMILHRFYGPLPPGLIDGDVAAVVNSISIPRADMTAIVRRQQVSNPTWFKEFYYVDPTSTSVSALRYLLVDGNGCYELAPHHVDPGTNLIDDGPPGNPNPANELVVVWMLTDRDYYNLTGRHLHATSIQRLTQAEFYTDANNVKHFAPHYLITNAYSGADNVVDVFGQFPNILPGQITGEVFEIRGKDYYDQPNSQAVAVAADGTYDGYLFAVINGGTAITNPNSFYTTDANGNLIVNVPLVTNTGSLAGSSIVRMIPNEQTIQLDSNNNLLRRAIRRSIGSYSDSSSSYLLQQPQFSDRPY